MKFVAFSRSGKEEVGVKLEQGVLPLQALAALEGNVAGLPETIDEIIRNKEMLAHIRRMVDEQAESLHSQLVQESDLVFLPCVPRPGKIICIGLNYRRHAIETNAAIPTIPIIFSKFSDTAAAHLETIPLPKKSSQVDYEAELGVVIGQRAVDVSREQALDYVFGYCNVNDLSARDLQTRTQQWLLGKTCEKFAPMGPYLVSADEIANPNHLRVKTYVNGEVRQDSNTEDMIFHVDELIQYLSEHMVLEPGDIILTGTPAGVILGLPESERVWLKAGDEVTIEIENLGALTNQFRN